MDVEAVGDRRAERAILTSATAAARASSSAAPTGSAPTRCTTPSCTGTRPRWRAGRQHDPIDAARRPAARRRRARRRRAGRARGEVAAEIDAAVAFAEAGDLGTGGRPRPATSTPEVRPEATRASTVTHDLPRGHARAPCATRWQPTTGSSSWARTSAGTAACFAVSKGLLDEFGPDRIRDTPLSESAFVGAGIGAAMGGHAPDRRDHDRQLQPAGARPDPEQRGHPPPHVGRPDRRPARDPDDDRRRPPAGRAALATASRAGTPTSPASRCSPRRTVEDFRGMLGPALADPDPGADLRARRPLQRRGRSCADAAASRRHRAVRSSAGPARDVTLDHLRRVARASASRPPRSWRRDGVEAEVVDLRVAAPARRRRRSSSRSPAPTAR